MTDRSEILNRSSGMIGGNRTRHDNKRPNADSAAGGPSTKKQKNVSAISLDFESILNRLPEDDEERRPELKAWAQLTVHSLSMNDLNYFLQQVKKTVETKKEKNKRTNSPKGNQINQGSSTNMTNGTANSAYNPRSPSDNEGSADGNKPSRAGSFYPMANMKDAEDEKKQKESEKAFQRPKAEKRSNEEENQYQELLHGIADNPVIVDDKLNENRFEEVLTEALSISKKLKDWFQIWSHCSIRNEQTTDCCVYLANRLCQEKDEEEIADILSHLMKEKEIGVKNIEEGIKRFQVGGRDVHKLVGHLLTFIYPTSKGDFGWQRVGWNFQHWWNLCKKLIRDLENPIEALQVCCEKLIEYKADLTADKQEKIIARGEELLGSRDAACETLGISGESDAKMQIQQASPDTSDA